MQSITTAVPQPLLIALALIAVCALSAVTTAAITRGHERAARRSDPAPYVSVLLVADGDKIVTGSGVVTVVGRAPMLGDGYLTVTLEHADGGHSRHDWPAASSVRVLTPPAPARPVRGALRAA